MGYKKSLTTNYQPLTTRLLTKIAVIMDGMKELLEKHYAKHKHHYS